MLSNLLSKIGMAKQNLAISKLSTIDAYNKLNASDLVLIDVREPNEWLMEGSPEGAKRIALQNTQFTDEVLSFVENNKDQAIAVCCRSGMRGDKAARLLLNSGFTDVMNVEGGFMKWRDEGLPIFS